MISDSATPSMAVPIVPVEVKSDHFHRAIQGRERSESDGGKADLVGIKAATPGKHGMEQKIRALLHGSRWKRN